MTPQAKAALIDYHVASDRKSKAEAILVKELTLDELIHAGLFVQAIMKYKCIVNCSIAQAKATMEARRDTIVDRTFISLYK